MFIEKPALQGGLFFPLMMDINRVQSLVQDILASEFPNDARRQKVYVSGNRLNFSCPYCGDSKSGHKKRGNFYLDTLSFKCYNGGCSIFKDGITFLKDFRKFDNLNSGEKTDILFQIRENKEKRVTRYGDFDVFEVLDGDFSDIVIPRSFLMKKLSLVSVIGTEIEGYIRSRNQVPDDRFLWDAYGKRIFILNLTKDKNILGLQTRNMESRYPGSSKYLTYKLSGIWTKMLKATDSEFIEKTYRLDPISSIFGIGTVNLSLPVTVFEGPLDSFLYPNSIATCSVENKVPFEMDGLRFWDDWDDAGRSKSTERLMNGEFVFNWGKFLADHSISTNGKWDLNDLVNYLRSTGTKIKRFEGYFTNDKLDIRWFIEG